MEKDLKIAAYYFPNYHIDAHNEQTHGKGWTEWELVKNAKPRFEGHQQPKVPLWGYEDESDPTVMAHKIREAKKYGIDCFIFDSYFYENEEFLNDCLNKGFLKAENTNDLKFALMWANHTWTNIHPGSFDKNYEIEFNGEVSETAFKRITNKIIKEYFIRENYFRIDGKPYFSIYEINSLFNVFKTVEKVNLILDEFREDARKIAGEIHINVVVGVLPLLPGEKFNTGISLLNKLNVDSYTSYCWTHHYPLNSFPRENYDAAANYYINSLDNILKESNKPYFPNVSMGWDASPRTNQDKEFKSYAYPYTPVVMGNTPEKFGNYLQQVCNFAKKTLKNPVVSINAWNEWTEGSYLEPDTVNGYKYLEEVSRVKNK